jgi:imidazolonepropionase-like amidohydrolase
MPTAVLDTFESISSANRHGLHFRYPPSPGLLASFLGAALLSGVGSKAQGQETPVAFVGAQIISISGEPIESGVLVVQRGKIQRVGPKGGAVPEGATVHDVSGKVIMPGLVDTHSHIGSPAGGDASAPIQPETRVLDAIDVRDPSLQKAQAGGITTVNVMPAQAISSAGKRSI